MDEQDTKPGLSNVESNRGAFRIRTVQTSPGPGLAGGGLTGRRGVPLAVPLPFLLTGALAAAAFGLLAPFVLPLAELALDFPHVLALVHIVTLGWLTMTIMGASLQLVPVIVVSPLRATALLRWQCPVFLCGVLCLLSGFWWWQRLLVLGGTVIVLSVVHYVIVLGTTFVHATTRPLTVWFLGASLVYLCLVVSMGLCVAWNFVTDILGATMEQVLLVHITLGVVGWLSCTLVGVSYTLGRLFLLAHAHDDRWGRLVFGLLNGGIVLLASGVLLSWMLLEWGGGALLVSAAGIFAGDCWRMLKVRQRKRLEVTQYHSLAATGYFVLVIFVGVVLRLGGRGETPATWTALGLAALVGWLGQSIVGYLYKIVPFLVWSERYGPLVGTQPVPLMRDLVHEQWSWTSWWLINLSLPALIGATLTQQVAILQAASGVLAFGLFLVLANLILVVRHLSASVRQGARSMPT